ncbi:MAG: Ig-like domain-containing protein [Bacteroidia bacterium]|nr:Ig-like domain-containing protein [Bacteroidia bacterium]
MLFASCANVVAPSGGDKDTQAPSLLQASPSNFSTNFSQKKITLEFDEYVLTKDPQTQVVISPPLKYPLEYLSKGKALQIKFSDTLLPNTTYNLNFGQCIVDLNEANPLPEFNYVFSTGSFIDSLRLEGVVKDALTGSTEKGVLVMAYSENIDSLPYKKIPSYFDRTDESGHFSIQNMAQGSYKLIALQEKNNNYLFDNPDEEKIGFLDSVVIPIYVAPPVNDTLQKDTLNTDTLQKTSKVKLHAEHSLPGLAIKVFTEKKEKQALKKWNYERIGKLQLLYNIPVNKLNYELLAPLSNNTWESVEYSTQRDSILLWFNDTISDSLHLRIWADTFPADTLHLSYRKLKKEAGGGKSKINRSANEVWQLQLPGTGMDPKGSILVSSPNPIQFADFTQALLISGKDTFSVKVKNDSLSARKFKVYYPWKEEKEYSFLIPPKALEDMYGKGNDTLKTTFKIKALKEFGNLKLSLKMENGKDACILQLLNEKGVMVREKQVLNGGTIQFPLLNPGNYGLRLLVDANQNGVWDTGKYLHHIQPEKVIIYSGKVEVKANWDLDLDWVVK